MKIGFLASEWSTSVLDASGHFAAGGTTHYRVLLPAKYLAANGVVTVVGESLFTRNGAIQIVDMAGERHDDCDLIVLQRWMHRDAERVILGAKSAGQIVVNDTDDWFGGLPTSNEAFAGSHPKLYPDSNVQHYNRALAASSALTVSTPYLAERLARFGVPTFVLRNAVECSAFPPRPFIAEKPTVGWTGSTRHRAGDLGILRGILGPYLERHDLRAFHCGALESAPSFADEAGISAGRLTEVGLLPMDEYPMVFAHFDLGVVPLTDTPFNRAKSCLKGLEYAAAGIPFVASALPEYEWLGAGVLCRRPKDWVRSLERLVDPDERRLLAKEQTERVQQCDIATRWTDWAAVYDTIAGS